MNGVLGNFLPVILIFVLGIIIRQVGIARKNDADFLLRVVFFIALPASIFISVSTVEITRDLLLLPLISMSIIFSLFLFSSWAVRKLTTSPDIMGVAIIGTMIMNMGFVYPFIMAVYTKAEFAHAVMFDLGNGLVTLTFSYYLACKYGAVKSHASQIVKKLLSSPPIWAIFLGLFDQFFGYSSAQIGSDVPRIH